MDKIKQILERDFETIENLKRSMLYMLSCKDRSHQFKIMHSAFSRTEAILFNRKKQLIDLIKRRRL